MRPRMRDAGLRRLVPDRLQELDDHRRIDLGDVQIAESLAGTLERLLPLPLMLRVPEAVQVLGRYASAQAANVILHACSLR